MNCHTVLSPINRFGTNTMLVREKKRKMLSIIYEEENRLWSVKYLHTTSTKEQIGSIVENYILIS
jgi:hypothetical protein